MIRAPMSAAAEQINRLFAQGTVSGLSDGQFLERFLDGRDEAAFAALVERHGPMVLSTCRAVVRDHGAAEDAFQATFLVLVCKARTIRGREALGGWLHRVAYRIAVQASADAARRRDRERLVGDVLVQDRSHDNPDGDWRQILHEEVARLSDKYRLPVLLCDLEGKTHAQAASELKWGEATVRRRLTGAHDLLRSRLARRGVGLTAAGLAAMLTRSAGAAVSRTCIQATVKAAFQMSSTAMRIAIGEVVSTTAAALVRKSLRAMLLGEVKTLVSVAMVMSVLGCLAWGVAVPGPVEGQAVGAKPRSRDVPVSVPAEANSDKPSHANENITYQGRVLDPDGHPFPGAALYLNCFGLNEPKNPAARATSGADGRFGFAVRRSDFDTSDDDAPWSFSTIEARAKGYAVGIANDRADGKALTLQLARDDVPITGRIIDLEGQPVAGVTVDVLDVRATIVGSLDDWLKAVEEKKELYNLESKFPNRLDRQTKPPAIPSVVTGRDGTFRIDGVGRERVATLQIDGPTIETKQFHVRTRPGEPIRVPGYAGETDLITIYGSRFEHVAGPTRPIEGIVRDQETGKPLVGIMVRGEKSLGNPNVYVRSITDAQGHFRLVGLPGGQEGHVVAVAPCDFPVFGSLKAVLNVPRDEELPYLPAGVAVPKTRGTESLHLDIKMKRGVWVTGRVIDGATGKPIRARVDYFVYGDNPAIQAFSGLRLDTHHFAGKDGTFQRVALPGPGVLAARASEDRYVFGAGIDSFKHKPEKGFLNTRPYHAVPTNYHVLVEIDPAPGTASLTHDLPLETGRSLTVTTLGPDGRPLTDMQIAGLKDMGYWETPPSDASTHTIISLKPGKGRTLTFLNVKKRLAGELVLRGDETEPQRVVLQPWGALTGRIVNGDGDPWVECQLTGVNLPGRYPKVGKDGRFRIEGLIPRTAYSVRILSDRFRLEGYIAKAVKVGPGETKDLHDVVPDNQGQ